MSLKNWRVQHILSLYLLFWGQILLFGQEEEQEQLSIELNRDDSEQEQTERTENPEAHKTIFYIIRSIDFDIKGRSRPFALIYHGEFKAGEKIEGEERLEWYIKDKTQLLLNQRVLDSVEITYTLGLTDADGRVPVDLLVTVADTLNIIGLPHPKFDSNSGFELIIKARDYNFLGTMSPLRVDLGYKHQDKDEAAGILSQSDVLTFEIDSDTPFHIFGLNWNFNFDHIFSYTFSDTDFFSYKNITGISVELPSIKRTVFTLGFDESSILSEENPERYKDEFGAYADFYMSSKPYLSWKIPLGIDVYKWGELTYTPEASVNVNYRPGGELEFWRKGPSATFSHSLEFGRIDWLGNYRQGLNAGIQNANTYNFHTQGWDNNYRLFVKGHKPFTDFFGISSFFQFRHWFLNKAFSNDQYPAYTEAGDALRGILNKSILAQDGDFMLSLNLDFTFQVLHFVPSEWLFTGKAREWLSEKKILRLFDFDLHIIPFIDMALFQGSKVKWGDEGRIEYEKRMAFSPQDMLFAGGIEFIIFPAFMRSFYVRASFGYNLNEWVQQGKLSRWFGDELFFGIGHHY